ncbi:MAG: DUF1684 domain-containing protein [Thermoplasmata archaeon]|nr:DUF1684 domain-containing protein [Thermoplasmata archaeon]
MGDYTEELEYERTMKDRFMAHHAESPFVAESVQGFHGLQYFPIDPRYVVKGQLVRRPVPEEAFLRTNRDGQAVMRLLGEVRFRLGGKPLRLRVYHAGEGVGSSVFVPFRDATSGRETYGPGRYLTMELNETDEYDLDFNRAFNPYCAYTDAYECGFPPAENDLPVPVPAGEKVWSKARNPATPNTMVLDLVEKATGHRPSTPLARKASVRKAPAPTKKHGTARRPSVVKRTKRRT